MPHNPTDLCDAFRDHIDEITLEWVRRVQNDRYMKSDDQLSLAQIVDHVPQMLEELCDLLSQENEPDFETIRASSQHGYIRVAEGYSLLDLLRELELLRDCVFNFVAETEIKHDINRADMLRALKTVNHYFGEDTLFIVEHFLKQSRATSGK
ncbi:MAG: RsbRD N-terminal domain-containing protein [Acidobacteriota bacterium]|nr:RsbRD N-terminal domain-containing protein [Acidobacteriota bacterium]